MHAEQVEHQLEVLVQHAGPGVGELWLQEDTRLNGPVRLKVGENRLVFELERTGEPLRFYQGTLGHCDSQGRLVDSQRVELVEPYDLPDHPSLALSPDRIRELRKRWLLEPRAQTIFAELLAEADDHLTSPLLIPDDGGTWTEGYRCPDHGVYLEMVTLHAHRCPTDGNIWTGQEFDSALATFLHFEAGHQAAVQSLAYMLTEDARYAQRVREILVGYAQKYPGYPLHDADGNPSLRGGKAFGQTLDEAGWLIDLVRAYDLLRGTSTLSALESKQFEENVIRQAVPVLQGNPFGIHNIQNWHNAGIMIGSLALRDPVTASLAVRGADGLHDQAMYGIDGDGLWYEGSFGYHFFTFQAMLGMLQTMQNIGMSVDTTAIQGMLDMPLRAPFPDGSLAMLNDGSRQAFSEGLRNVYEQALAFWPRAEFCSPLVEYGRGLSYESVVYGIADLPFQDTLDVDGANFEQSGLAVLAAGPKGDRSTAMVDYGPHGGFHGHRDKLGLGVWHRQRPVLLEAGAVGYGTAISDEYYTRTLAHNTVVIDGQDQAECTGALEAFEVMGVNKRVIASADDAYPGTQLRRQVVNTEWGHLVDGVVVTAPQVSTIDYVLHSADRILHNYSVVPGDLGYGGAYGYLTDVHTVTLDQDLEFEFESPLGKSTINVIGEAGTQVFLAKAPGFPFGSTHDVLILRRQADHTVFGATITDAGSGVDGFEIELDDRPGDPALKLKVLGVGQIRLPFYP